MEIMQVWSMTRDELEENMQTAKYSLLHYLYDEGVINEKQFQDYAKNIALVVRKSSFFSDFWKKFIGKNEEEKIKVIVVRQHSLKEDYQEIEEIEEIEDQDGIIEKNSKSNSKPDEGK